MDKFCRRSSPLPPAFERLLLPAALLFLLSSCGGNASSPAGPKVPVSSPDHPPVITWAAQAGPEMVCPSQATTLSLGVMDPDIDSVAVAWTASGGTISGSGPLVAWNAPDIPGTYTVHATATDGRGDTVRSDGQVDVRDGTLLGITMDGVVKFADDGSWNVIVPGRFGGIVVWGDRAWVHDVDQLCTLDVSREIEACGYELGYLGEYPGAGAIPEHSGVTLLPASGLLRGRGMVDVDTELGFAALWDSAGGLMRSYVLTPNGVRAGNTPAPTGMVVGGDFEGCCTLDTSPGDPFAIDLTTGDFTPYTLGLQGYAFNIEIFSMTYGGGARLYGLGSTIFESVGRPPLGTARTLFSVSPDQVVSSVVVDGPYVYASTMVGGHVFRVDRATGGGTVFAQGLNGPTDLVCLPGA